MNKIYHAFEEFTTTYSSKSNDLSFTCIEGEHNLSNSVRGYRLLFRGTSKESGNEYGSVLLSSFSNAPLTTSKLSRDVGEDRIDRNGCWISQFSCKL